MLIWAGHRPRYSTDTAMVALADLLNEVKEEEPVSMPTFVDLSAAFSIVDETLSGLQN